MGHHFTGVEWSDSAAVFNFVHQIAPRPGLKLYEDLIARLRKMAPLVGYMFGALVVASLGAWLVRQVPFLMVVGALLVQWLGCSGITYNIIHGMQWKGNNEEMISKSQRRMISKSQRRNAVERQQRGDDIQESA